MTITDVLVLVTTMHRTNGLSVYQVMDYQDSR